MNSGPVLSPQALSNLALVCIQQSSMQLNVLCRSLRSACRVQWKLAFGSTHTLLRLELRLQHNTLRFVDRLGQRSAADWRSTALSRDRLQKALKICQLCHRPVLSTTSIGMPQSMAADAAAIRTEPTGNSLSISTRSMMVRIHASMCWDRRETYPYEVQHVCRRPT